MKLKSEQQITSIKGMKQTLPCKGNRIKTLKYTNAFIDIHSSCIHIYRHIYFEYIYRYIFKYVCMYICTTRLCEPLFLTPNIWLYRRDDRRIENISCI
jgi:hypothetical protein